MSSAMKQQGSLGRKPLQGFEQDLSSGPDGRILQYPQSEVVMCGPVRMVRRGWILVEVKATGFAA